MYRRRSVPERRGDTVAVKGSAGARTIVPHVLGGLWGVRVLELGFEEYPPQVRWIFLKFRGHCAGEYSQVNKRMAAGTGGKLTRHAKPPSPLESLGASSGPGPSGRCVSRLYLGTVIEDKLTEEPTERLFTIRGVRGGLIPQHK